MKRLKIEALAKSVPEMQVSNDDLAEFIETSDEQELKTDGSVFSTTRPIFVPKRQKSCFQKRRRRLRKLI